VGCPSDAAKPLLRNLLRKGVVLHVSRPQPRAGLCECRGYGSTMAVGATVHVESVRFLDFVNALIHDQYFDPQEIVFDEQQGSLTIPFEFEDTTREEIVDRTWRGRKKRARVPILRGLLTIAAVTDWELKDTEGVGTYDFNELLYDEGRDRLQVLTNIPLELSVTISRVDVTVELTDQHVWFRPVRYLPRDADVRGGSARSD
jgi:hypothetical protein